MVAHPFGSFAVASCVGGPGNAASVRVSARVFTTRRRRVIWSAVLQREVCKKKEGGQGESIESELHVLDNGQLCPTRADI
eukprot:1175706-Prorocentrum_minimum.AAC.3